MEKHHLFLKKRSQEFWQAAAENLAKNRYNLAALCLEQTLQLYLKYLIYLKAGDFPKTHYFDELMDLIGEHYNQVSIAKHYETHVVQYNALEDAYISSRYLPREFSQNEVEELMEFSKSSLKTL